MGHETSKPTKPDLAGQTRAVRQDEQMERENSENNLKTETVPLELDLAWMHHFGLLGVGVEFRNNNMVSEGRWQRRLDGGRLHIQDHG